MSSPALNLPTLDRVAVLASGGIDSSVLIGDLAGHAGEVTPIYIRFGLHWERDEEAALGRYLRLLGREQVVELKVFELPLRAVYGKHWSATGVDVPGLHSRDEAVYLPGRNVLQLVQPAIWCHLNGVPHLALATLRNNPFPDATPQFFELLQQALRMATNSDIRIIRPYEQLQKIDVLLRGRDLPLAATWSCIRPVGGVHCGACNKCAERRRAFASASLTDPTTYAADR